MQKPLNATEKIVALLECVAGPGQGLRAPELAQMLGLDRATVYRLAGQLADLDMLSIDPDTRRVTIGSRAYHIGYAYIRNSGMAAKMYRCLALAAQEMPMLISLAIADRRVSEGLVFDLFNITTLDRWGIRYEEGIYKPVNHDSHGRLLMAFHQPADELERIVRSLPLTAVSPKSITDADALLAEYAAIRERGAAVSLEVSAPGINGLAMPVRGGGGRVIASVAADIPAESWEGGGQARLMDIVARCVQNIERLFPAGVEHWAWL